MLDQGADVRHMQEILGHKSLQTTQIYTHVSIGKLCEVHARTHPARLVRRLSPRRRAYRGSLLRGRPWLGRLAATRLYAWLCRWTATTRARESSASGPERRSAHSQEPGGRVLLPCPFSLRNYRPDRVQ